jgi:hypothetical protein
MSTTKNYPTRLVRNRDKVHTRDCRYSVPGVSTPWRWAQGRTNEEILREVRAAGAGIKFCRVCKPIGDDLAEESR